MLLLPNITRIDLLYLRTPIPLASIRRTFSKAVCLSMLLRLCTLLQGGPDLITSARCGPAVRTTTRMKLPPATIFLEGRT